MIAAFLRALADWLEPLPPCPECIARDVALEAARLAMDRCYLEDAQRGEPWTPVRRRGALSRVK